MTSPTDHYSVLQTIEDMLGLPLLRRHGCACTVSLKPLLAARLARRSVAMEPCGPAAQPADRLDLSTPS